MSGWRARLRARLVVATVCFGAAAIAAPAPSQNAARLKARALYADGDKALDTGDVDTAQKDFEAAYETLPNAAVLLRIAECKSRRGDYRGAVEDLERYLTDRPSAPDRGAVEAKITGMKSKPGRLTVKSSPSAASIWVDGTDTSLVTPSEVELSPGEHALELRLSSYKTAEQSVVVEYASKQQLELTLALPTSEGAGRGAVADTSPTEPDSGGGYRTTPAFWVAVGGAVAGVGVTTVFGVIALNKQADFDKHPTRALYDDGKQAALVSDIALGVAGACAVTAGVLFFTSKRNGSTPDHAFVVGPTFGRGGAGLAGHLRF